MTKRCASAALLAALCVVAAGCPDLGDRPFLCNNGTPRCPDDYVCDETINVCVRSGTPLTPRVDARVTQPDKGVTQPDQGGPPPDQGGPPPDQGTPPPGKRIVITEFMADPDAVLDSQGEYVELFNVTNQPIDINGWTIKDEGSDSHTINAGGSLIVPANGYIVLGINKNPSQNGGVSVAYQYSQFFLSNKADEVLIIDTGGKIVDKFAYDDSKGWTIPRGAALSVRNPFLDKNNAASWCQENKTWSGSSGDKGTPKSNPGCL